VLRALGGAIAKRADAIFAVHSPEGDRQLKLDGGDISTVSSTCPEDALPLFLARQGRVRSDVAHRIAARPAKHPRHVAAALVAEGWLTQDELWTVLAAHASSILAAMLGLESGTMEGGPLHVPGRPTGGTYDAKSLALDDDSPFGGRPGATVFVDAARRSIDPTRAVFAAGGPDARIGAVLLPALLRECGLTEREERELLVPDRTLAQLSGPDERDALACVLAALGIFQFVVPLVPAQKVAPSSDEQLLADGRALEERLALRLSMVEEGDYFSVLGVSRNANGYEVRGAYLRLKNEFSTQRLETLGLAARRKDVEKVLFVLEEAYEVLRDESKRDRYRRAIS
jgi:hypothetical protein